MSIALVKAFELNIVEHASKDIVFSDVSNSGTLAKYVKAIYYNGITQGVGGNVQSDKWRKSQTICSICC